MGKKMKSAVVMILSLALAGAVLTGCGESSKSSLETEQDNPQSTFQDSQQDTVADETTGSETEEPETEEPETEGIKTEGSDQESEGTKTEGSGQETEETKAEGSDQETKAEGSGQETEGVEQEGRITEKYEDNFAVDSTAAKEFAGEVKDAAANQDLEALADLTAFPVYVDLPDVGVVDTREDFLKLGAETVFTEELLQSIEKADIEDLQPSMAGFSISDGGTCNINFGVVDGVLAIKGINY